MTHFLDMIRKAGENPGKGALWGMETQDLDCTLVAWPKGGGVSMHSNDEIDVLMIVIDGRALIEMEGKDQQLSEGQLLILRKGTSRRIEALSERLVYLNVHKRRRGLSLAGMDAYRNRT